MSTQMPTIVLVHGAFAESASWNPVIKMLHDHGTKLVASAPGPCEVVAVANPLRSLEGDAAYVRDVISSIGGPVILVGHSYGGMVITEAAARNDAVTALVYVAAFTPDHGESAFQLSAMFPGSTLGEALNAYPLSAGGNELAIRRELFHQQFCADVHEEQAALMAATQRPIVDVALTAGLPTDRPAWRDIPSWFVFGEEDRNIPVELIRFFAQRAGSRGNREVMGASHAISVSQPAVVCASILDAVGATVGGQLAVAP